MASLFACANERRTAVTVYSSSGTGLGRTSDEPVALRDRLQVLRLPEHDGVAVAPAQAGPASGCPLDHPCGERAAPQAVHRQQLADRQRDRAGFIGETDQPPLQLLVGRDLRLGDQAVDRVAELARERHRVGALERGADEERRGYVSEVDAVVMQRIDLPFGAARDRDEHLEPEALADKKALTFGHRDREREDAA